MKVKTQYRMPIVPNEDPATKTLCLISDTLVDGPIVIKFANPKELEDMANTLRDMLAKGHDLFIGGLQKNDRDKDVSEAALVQMFIDEEKVPLVLTAAPSAKRPAPPKAKPMSKTQKAKK